MALRREAVHEQSASFFAGVVGVREIAALDENVSLCEKNASNADVSPRGDDAQPCCPALAAWRGTPNYFVFVFGTSLIFRSSVAWLPSAAVATIFRLAFSGRRATSLRPFLFN